MQIIQWLLRVADEPAKESNGVTTYSRTNKQSWSARTKEVPLSNHLEANQRPKRVRNISLGCENFTLFTILRRRDISKTSFYNTLHLKRVDTMKLMKKEAIARGLGTSNNKGQDLTPNHVGNTKVLPLTDDALSSRHQLGNEEKRDQKARSEKTKTLSKMKELVGRAAAAKSEKGGKHISRKVSQSRNRAALKSVPEDGKLSHESPPKISFRWDMESCSTTSSVYSALSKASSKRIIIDQPKNIHHSSYSTHVRDNNHSTTTKSGNWITTDSDFVVLEL